MTSDERREVASALRGDPNDTLIPQSRDGFEGMTYHEAAYRFWNMCRRVRDAANVDIAYSTTSVLADLIDPTCEVKDDNRLTSARVVSADLVRELSEAGEVDLDGRDAETVAEEASDLVMERLLSDPLYDDLVRECIGEAVSE